MVKNIRMTTAEITRRILLRSSKRLVKKSGKVKAISAEVGTTYPAGTVLVEFED